MMRAGALTLNFGLARLTWTLSTSLLVFVQYTVVVYILYPINHYFRLVMYNLHTSRIPNTRQVTRSTSLLDPFPNFIDPEDCACYAHQSEQVP